MWKLLLIALGGAAGSVLRYWLQGLGQRAGAGVLPVGFPAGTLLVNVLGCLVIGVLSGVFSGTQAVRPEYRLGLTVGLLGGFTTFSALGLESYQLLHAGQSRLAVGYVLISLAGGLAAVWVGFRLGQSGLAG